MALVSIVTALLTVSTPQALPTCGEELQLKSYKGDDLSRTDAAQGVPAPRPAPADVPCVTTVFKTQMVKDACTKGRQAEAKKVMKKFLSTAKAKNPSVTDCKSCHSALGPDFKLTSDALEKFQKAGGK